MLNKSEISLHKQLLTLAIPMILSNITVPLLGLVDTAVLGHLSQPYFLGGSTIGVMLITFVTWLCGFLRMSTTGLAAQAYGKQNNEENTYVLFRGIVVALAIGLAVIVLQIPFISSGLLIAGGSEQVQFYAHQYASIRVYGLPAALANLVILGWLLGNHKAKAVMWLLILTNSVNLILDILFVVVFDWQVKGVAWATLIAEYSGFLVAAIYIFRLKRTQNTEVSLSLFKKVAELKSLTTYFKLNGDILVRTICLQISFYFITFQGARLGDVVVATNAILMNFILLISFGLDGIANAAEAMAGKAYGESAKAKLKQVVTTSLWWTGMLAIVYSLMFVFAGEAIVGLLSDIDSIIAYADDYLWWMVIIPLFACWCFLFDGIYIGLMQVKVMRNTMALATFAVFFPAWYLTSSWGNHALWFAMSMFMLSRSVFLWWHYRFKLFEQLSFKAET
ncbi:MATE family efflux transporter [Thalassotalea agarivorans]|uniref:Multidrug resistance protein, MATE family n=1 Tax=Thalassotalea agarivorans TaxID=349064 RepID=A0A1I0HQP8_THASX|nr:MATE family efflux transporter [Thalassotalea agarivorans]SET85488.1 multidrug resistance protein, MATE family [Thalassotalea agarivorans]